MLVCCIFHPTESEDHKCEQSKANSEKDSEDSIPSGKNVYEYQPKYKNKE